MKAESRMPEQRLHAARRARAHDAHQEAEDHRVHQALGVLPVVDGAYARDEPEQAGQAGRHVAPPPGRPPAGCAGGAAAAAAGRCSSQ